MNRREAFKRIGATALALSCAIAGLERTDAHADPVQLLGVADGGEVAFSIDWENSYAPFPEDAEWQEFEVIQTGSENGWATFASTGRYRYGLIDGSVTDWISPEGNDQ